jgi:hypothetical protein
MMSRAKYWMGLNKPKSQHSLDNLKYFFMKKVLNFILKKLFLKIFVYYFKQKSNRN